MDEFGPMGKHRSRNMDGELHYLKKENQYLQEEIEKLKGQLPKEESFVREKN